MQFGGAVSIALVPLGLHGMIEGIGWRGTYVVLAAALAAVLWPLVAIFYRQHPGDVGQRVDGEPTGGDAAAAAGWLRVVDDANPPSLNLREAMRTQFFWLLLISTAAWSLIATGLIFHIESLLVARRLTLDQTAWATPLLATSMAVVLLGGGWLVDRVSIRALLACALALVASGCVVLARVDGLAALAAYIAYGVGQGLMTVVGSASWAKYFGPAHLGHIRGVSMTVGIACSALGPLVMGASADYLGGFEPSLWFFTAVAVSVAMIGAVAGGEGGGGAVE
jgi:cyanate permease